MVSKYSRLYSWKYEYEQKVGNGYRPSEREIKRYLAMVKAMPCTECRGKLFKGKRVEF